MTQNKATPPTDPKTNAIAGALYGALVGDALGVPVEFESRAALRKQPVKRMEEYGAWQQPKGTWSDDGALTLASAWTLTQSGRLDYAALADSFVAWWRQGFMCAGDSYFDIGGITRTALSHWMVANTNIADADACEMGGTDEHSNGNGSLMRIMPVALWTVYDDGYGEDDFPYNVERASAITHGHWQSKMACALYAGVARQIVRTPHASKLDIFHQARNSFLNQYGIPTNPRKFEMFWRVTNPRFAEVPEDAISTSGYVIDSLEASLWCWLNTESYSEATLRAVNLGGDTDTTGCITGALAGLYYGLDAIPTRWVKALRKPALLRDTIYPFAAATIQHWNTSQHAE